MKFYNPFKWHIVEINGMYFVRRLSFFPVFFIYVDFATLRTWSLKSHVYQLCKHGTEDAARNTLNRITMKARYIG